MPIPGDFDTRKLGPRLLRADHSNAYREKIDQSNLACKHFEYISLKCTHTWSRNVFAIEDQLKPYTDKVS